MAQAPRPLTRNELAMFLPNDRAIRAFELLFDLIPADLIALQNSIDLVAEEAASNSVLIWIFAE